MAKKIHAPKKKKSKEQLEKEILKILNNVELTATRFDGGSGKMDFDIQSLGLKFQFNLQEFEQLEGLWPNLKIKLAKFLAENLDI